MIADPRRTWRQAMSDALYGATGFYRASGAPSRHFRTAAHVSPAWARSIATLAGDVDHGLGEPDGFTVIDMGAGGGELLAGLATTAPERWRLLGVDLAPRPSSLPERVGWSDTLPAEVDGMLIAVEWLDVVPIDVVALTADGVRLVEVDAAGSEGLGGRPDDSDLRWLERWWPLAEVGDRAEVGRPRDAAWADAVGRLRSGIAVAVDYAAVPSRDVAGTLTGYRDGRQVLPVPDGSMDLTAHVVMEACLAAAAADESTLMTQRDALRALGLSAERPAYDVAPASYVAALSAASEAAELLDRDGLGGFTWIVQAKQTVLPGQLATVRGSRP